MPIFLWTENHLKHTHKLAEDLRELKRYLSEGVLTQGLDKVWLLLFEFIPKLNQQETVKLLRLHRSIPHSTLGTPMDESNLASEAWKQDRYFVPQE